MSDFHLHLKMMAIIQFNKITFKRCKLRKIPIQLEHVFMSFYSPYQIINSPFNLIFNRHTVSQYISSEPPPPHCLKYFIKPSIMISSASSSERNLTFSKNYIYKEEWKYSEWSLFLDYLIGIFSKFGTLKRHKYT